MAVDDRTDESTDHYRCPYCSSKEYTSAKEREVRIHIELASDGNHKGREGFSPLTDVEAIDADGTVIENTDGMDVKREPDEFAEICEPADDLAETERRIVATKSMHLDHSAADVAEFLEEQGDRPSERHIHKTLRDYFGTTDTAREARSYEDFSERQRAAIDAAARYELGEFETQTEAAQTIDEMVEYVNRYYNEYQYVVEDRVVALENGGEDGDEKTDAGTIRRNNGVGTYVGSEQGIDAMMQHISERPAKTDTGSDAKSRDEMVSDSEADRDIDSELITVRGQLDILRRLVVNEELDTEAAFDEVERILTDAVAT